MFQGEVWIKRLANEINLDQGRCHLLWSTFVRTLEDILLSGQKIYIDQLGTWQLSIQEEYIVGTPSPTHLIPPHLQLRIAEEDKTQDMLTRADIVQAINQQTQIDEGTISQCLDSISRLTKNLLLAGQEVVFPELGYWVLANEQLMFSVDPEFASKLNKAFSVFSIQELTDGIDTEGLEYRAIPLEQVILYPPSLLSLKIFEKSSSLIVDHNSEKASTSDQKTEELPWEDEPIILEQDDRSSSAESLSTDKEDLDKVSKIRLRDRRLYIVLFLLILVIISMLALYAWRDSHNKQIINKLHQENQTLVSRHLPKYKVDTALPIRLTHAHLIGRQDTTLYLKEKQDSTSSSKKTQSVSTPPLTEQQTEVNKAKKDTEHKSHEDKLVTKRTKANNDSKPPRADIAEDITIQSDESLASIAQRKYGHRAFWVYIYEENRERIPNPHSIPVGTRLSLPPAHKYNIDPNNTKSVQQALVLSRSI